MSRRLSAVLTLLAVALLVVAPASAIASGVPVNPNKPNSAELVEDNKKWDGKTITFRGEAIGEVMKRGNYAWIHLNDDAYEIKNVEEGAKLGGYNSGMAVFIPSSLTDQITHYGDYKHEGDIVTVTGTFNAACPQHGGDMDIHATSLVVDVPGHDVVDVVKEEKIFLAFVLAFLSFTFWYIDRTWKPDTEGFWQRVLKRDAR